MDSKAQNRSALFAHEVLHACIYTLKARSIPFDENEEVLGYLIEWMTEKIIEESSYIDLKNGAKND